jgi:hypothetical protein
LLLKSLFDFLFHLLVDHSPFSQEEENYICELVEEYHQKTDNRETHTISWKDLQLKVEVKFGKFRSQNSIKNVWYSNKRRNERLAKVKGNETIEDVD